MISVKYITWVINTLKISLDDPRRLEWIVKSYNQGVGNTLKEMKNPKQGYANDYWAKWQKQFTRVVE